MGGKFGPGKSIAWVFIIIVVILLIVGGIVAYKVKRSQQPINITKLPT
jgi:hypothetical protein